MEAILYLYGDAPGDGVGAAVGTSVGGAVGVAVGVAVGAGVGAAVGTGPPLRMLRKALPYLVVLSTPVPSPHSLKVVISCQGSPEAFMATTFAAQRVRSRARTGLVSVRFQNPGLIA